MSDLYYNRLIIKAPNNKASSQLKELVQSFSSEQKLSVIVNSQFEQPSKNISTDDSINNFKYNWNYFFGGYDAKIILENPTALVVDFYTRGGSGRNDIVDLSRQFPDLYFSCLDYLHGEENVVEGQNGNLVNHFYRFHPSEEIKSNELKDYKRNSVLLPKDSNGTHYPFNFLVADSSRIIVTFTETITLLHGRKVLGAEQYMHFFEMNLLKLRNEKLIGLPINYGREENSIEYSIMLDCTTVDEAIAESLKIMKEFHKPVDDFINKAIEIAKVDFNMKPEHFEFPKVVLPI